MKSLYKFCSLLTLFFCTFAFAEQGKFELFQFERVDGQSQPYVLYSPKNIDTNQPRPLIVYLHGAVSAPKLQIDPMGAAKRSPMVKLADEGSYYVLFPYGQKGISWFENAGIEMVLAEIDAVKQKVKINENKVFLSGFSDGGSGTFYFAATQSDPFAGFIPLNGAVAVAANIGDSPVYLENFNQKPFYIVNTLSDMLYPARLMQPLIDKVLQYHPTALFKTPEGNHDMAYFPALLPEIKQFIEQHQRQAVREISFESADNFSNKYAWLSITKLAEQQSPQSWHQTYSLKMINDKASLGVGFDMKHRGVGMKITGTKKGSIAEKMGIQAGDVIVKLEETPLDNRYAVFNYLASKKAGDSTYLTIEREGQNIKLEGNFPPAYEYEVFTKQPISGKVKAKLQGNKLSIETSRVAEIKIDFEQLPLDKKYSHITLEINHKAQQVEAKGQQYFSIN